MWACPSRGMQNAMSYFAKAASVNFAILILQKMHWKTQWPACNGSVKKECENKIGNCQSVTVKRCQLCNYTVMFNNLTFLLLLHCEAAGGYDFSWPPSPKLVMTLTTEPSLSTTELSIIVNHWTFNHCQSLNSQPLSITVNGCFQTFAGV